MRGMKKRGPNVLYDLNDLLFFLTIIIIICSPSVSHTALGKFEELLRRSVQSITNSDITDMQRIQASLPVKDSGLRGSE